MDNIGQVVNIPLSGSSQVKTFFGIIRIDVTFCNQPLIPFNCHRLSVLPLAIYLCSVLVLLNRQALYHCVLCAEVAVEKAVENWSSHVTCTRLSMNVKVVYDTERC